MKYSLVPCVLLVVVSACSKPSPEEQKKKEAELAAAIGSALSLSATAPPSSAASPSAAPPTGGIQATCNNKGDSVCTETLGAAGLGAESSCTMLGGVYVKSSAPCPRENLVGTCTQIDATSGLNDIRYLYKDRGAAADLKVSCEGIMNGVWATAPTAAPKAAAAKAGAKAPTAAPKPKK